MTKPALRTRIDSPTDLRRLADEQLPQLAEELRASLLESVARSGGHLAAGLGTVELTIALHYLYDTPHDALVWDVGHQAYPHKMLTGRRDALAWLPSRRARKASTTRSAWGTQAPRSAPRSAWRPQHAS